MDVTTIDVMLLPTDGSDGALTGASRGLELAQAVGAEVHVLSVVDASELEGLSGLLESDVAALRETLESEAEAAVEAVEASAAERGLELTITTSVEYGTPFRVIEQYVETEAIDLVAMGTKGRTGLERILVGSVTENVLRTAEVPVLAVPPEAADRSLARDAVDGLLLPTDGSEGATAAIDWGLGLADTYDAMVHAVFSADTKRIGGATDPDGILRELERIGDDALEDVRTRAREQHVSVTGTVASGRPARVILDFVERTDSDVVVMGTHGRSGLQRPFLGSVTETVVRGADVPVLCVPVASAD